MFRKLLPVVGVLACLATRGIAQDSTLVYSYGVQLGTPGTYAHATRGLVPSSVLTSAINGHTRATRMDTTSTVDFLTTASAAGRGVWYVAMYSQRRDDSFIYMTLDPTVPGTLVDIVHGKIIYALALGEFRGATGYKLIVGMNGSHGEGASVWSLDAFVTLPNRTILYPENPYWRITALAAGDFNGTGFDRLAYGFSTPTRVECGIWVCDYQFNTRPNVPLALGQGFSISALAAGDFNGFGRKDLVTALMWRSTSGATRQSAIWRHSGESSSTRAYLDSTGYFWNYQKIVDSMVCGRFENSRVEQLVVSRQDKYGGLEVRYCGSGLDIPGWNLMSGFPGLISDQSQLHLSAFPTWGLRVR
jgi:hypothetical protein